MSTSRAVCGLGQLWLALGIILCAPACQQSDTHPPLTGDCSGDPVRCNPHPGNIGVGFLGGDGGPQNSTVDAGPQGTLSGNVLVLDDLVHAQTYTLPADIHADGASMAVTSASWDGTNPFVLMDVKSELANWVNVQPTTQGADEQLTLTPVETVATTSQDVFVVRGTTLDGIFDLLTAKPLRDLAHAQIVAKFLDATTGAPLAGLAVSIQGAADVAYADANSWTDVAGTVTDNTGMVVFANVPATGAPAGITVSGARTSTDSVLAVAGAVSVAAFLVP